jgi:hypothetical protein
MHELRQEVGALTRLDLFALRAQWERRFGPAPRFRSVELFRLMLAWRLQAEVHGGLDPATRKALRSTGRVVAEGQELGLGATLRRSWNGEEVVVEVIDGGFRWNDQTFKSLSAVASAITGARWNGPKFFGLRS